MAELVIFAVRKTQTKVQRLTLDCQWRLSLLYCQQFRGGEAFMDIIHISISFFNSLQTLSAFSCCSNSHGFGKEYPNLHKGGSQLICSIQGSYFVLELGIEFVSQSSYQDPRVGLWRISDPFQNQIWMAVGVLLISILNL